MARAHLTWRNISIYINNFFCIMPHLFSSLKFTHQLFFPLLAEEMPNRCEQQRRTQAYKLLLKWCLHQRDLPLSPWSDHPKLGRHHISRRRTKKIESRRLPLRKFPMLLKIVEQGQKLLHPHQSDPRLRGLSKCAVILQAILAQFSNFLWCSTSLVTVSC